MKPMDDELPIHYVALYQSAKSFPNNPGIRKAGEVIRCYQCRRKDIPDLPPKPARDNDLYYVFEVKKWRDVKSPIRKKVLGIQSYMFTTQYLIANAKDVPDLYIQDAAQWRIFKELRRKAEDELVLIGKVSPSFSYSNYDFVFENGYLSVYDISVMPHKIPYQKDIAYFGKHPKECFEEIKKAIGL